MQAVIVSSMGYKAAFKLEGIDYCVYLLFLQMKGDARSQQRVAQPIRCRRLKKLAKGFRLSGEFLEVF